MEIKFKNDRNFFCDNVFISAQLNNKDIVAT